VLPVLGEKILRAKIVIQGHTPPAPDGPWQGACPSHIMGHISHYMLGASKMPRLPPWRPTCKRIYLFHQDKRQIYRERERGRQKIFTYKDKSTYLGKGIYLFYQGKRQNKSIYIYICREKERKDLLNRNRLA